MAFTAMHRPQKIVAELTRRLSEGRLRSGAFLTERHLMEEFVVGRGVAREALARLQMLGIVDQRRGVRTRVLAATAFRDTATIVTAPARQELLLGLASEAACLAATRRTLSDLALLEGTLVPRRHEDQRERDFRFRVALARATHNVHFVAALSALVDLERSVGSRSPDQRGLRTVARLQSDAVAAIRRKDTATAAACTRMSLTVGDGPRAASAES